jgi:hypothetical protein
MHPQVANLTVFPSSGEVYLVRSIYKEVIGRVNPNKKQVDADTCANPDAQLGVGEN